VGATPCSVRYFSAGLLGLMDPAGEMWSVVMLSAQVRQHAVRG